MSDDIQEQNAEIVSWCLSARGSISARELLPLEVTSFKGINSFHPILKSLQRVCNYKKACFIRGSCNLRKKRRWIGHEMSPKLFQL